MRKILFVTALMAMFPLAVYAEQPGQKAEAWVVTVNTTTFTALPQARKTWVYNPGSFDIDLATSTTCPAAKRFTVKAATYLPYPLEINAVMYAIATDSNSVSLETLLTK